ncbi:hypothetical protein QYE76_059813 [Lolium multiflorum]|uniref:Reverse transcriptase domain-containing protein n=1 Tax=Lolium multiflorum TaxID=4521 RepID=A0AAD8RZ94_LOLMU|nr:hypothetical protein QYE76_059813 [Lolium multiflorum]
MDCATQSSKMAQTLVATSSSSTTPSPRQAAQGRHAGCGQPGWDDSLPPADNTKKILLDPAQDKFVTIAKPVKQPLRRFAEERRKAIGEEIARLLAAGFIMEVLHPDWLANPVLVLKKNGSWRMCTPAPNKACPKDPFPLPRIDQVIDSTAGCELLSFLDAYSGYHQIPLNPADQIKTSFITPSKLSEIEEERLLEILKKHRGAIGYTLDDLKGISPSICQHAINMEDDAKPVVEPQRRLIPKMKEVVRNEVLRLLEAGIIYPIADSRWVSPVHCVPKKGGMTVVPNDNDELIPQRVVVGCMSAIFHGFCESIVEVFMDDFSVYGNSFDSCLRNLDKVLQRCEETNLVLNWEKCHFMVNEGIVLGHKISKRGIEVDRAKVEAIEKMPYPRDVKDRKGADNPVADNLSRLENIAYDPVPVNDSFPNEQLAVIKVNSRDSPWICFQSRSTMASNDKGKGLSEEEVKEGPLPPALSLDSFPMMEEVLRVTDEFCDQYRAREEKWRYSRRRTAVSED